MAYSRVKIADQLFIAYKLFLTLNKSNIELKTEFTESDHSLTIGQSKFEWKLNILCHL